MSFIIRNGIITATPTKIQAILLHCGNQANHNYFTIYIVWRAGSPFSMQKAGTPDYNLYTKWIHSPALFLYWFRTVIFLAHITRKRLKNSNTNWQNISNKEEQNNTTEQKMNYTKQGILINYMMNYYLLLCAIINIQYSMFALKCS